MTMDQQRFDNLARALSRRTTLKAALGVLLGAGAMTAALDDAGATKPRRGRPFGSTCTADRQCASPFTCKRDRRFPRTERNRCGCPFGETWCADLRQCVVIGSDDHCNGCGDICFDDTTCCAGDEANSCTDTSTDALHCGSCGRPCPEGSDCVDSECVAPLPCSDRQAYEDAGCPYRCFALVNGQQDFACGDTNLSQQVPCQSNADCDAIRATDDGPGGLHEGHITSGVIVVECVVVASDQGNDPYLTGDSLQQGLCWAYLPASNPGCEPSSCEGAED
jgi:hypothetical protein